jgi:hypothetical protein
MQVDPSYPAPPTFGCLNSERASNFLSQTSTPRSNLPSCPQPQNVEGTCSHPIDDVIWQRAFYLPCNQQSRQSVFEKMAPAMAPFPGAEDFVVGLIGMGDMGKMYARRLSSAGWR